MTAAPDDEEIERAIVRVADLLYVVRSNLQHGEKFASPDPVRISRDRLISEKVTRVLALFFDLLLGRPLGLSD
jgi:hypothetical protein